MARNQAAFDARGVQLIAISVDTVAQSQAMVAKLGVRFPVLSDDGAKVAGTLVGIDDAELAIPGVVVVARGGAVVFRQIASSKDDRLSTADLLAVIDDKIVGHKGVIAVDDSFAAIRRSQLSFDAGVGVGDKVTTASTRTATLATEATLAFAYPLSRRFLVGGELRSAANIIASNTTATVSVGAKATLRLPFWHDLGALHLSVSGGPELFAPQANATFYTAASSQLWFAVRPQWALQLGVGLTSHWHGFDSVDAIHAGVFTIGLARLLAP